MYTGGCTKDMMKLQIAVAFLQQNLPRSTVLQRERDARRVAVKEIGWKSMMGRRRGSCSPTRSSSSSSGEEDGEANWKAAIDSVSMDFTLSNKTHSAKSNGVSSSTRSGAMNVVEQHGELDQDTNNPNPQNLKLYQIKAQKLLENLLDKRLEMVSDSPPTLDDDTTVEESGIRLFRHTPLSTTFDPTAELQQPKKRPKILPGEEIEEKSKKFRHRVQAVVVDGTDIIAKAREACQRSIARLEAKDAAAKAAAKREEERVSELKKIRGEKWLPSIAKEMQVRTKLVNSFFNQYI